MDDRVRVGWIDGRMDGWMMDGGEDDGWMRGWMDQYIPSILHFSLDSSTSLAELTPQ